MATILKTYATPAELCIECLKHEIEISGHVDGFEGITSGTSGVKVIGNSILDEPGLDAVIAAHDGESLESLKIKKRAEIDVRTQELIAQGFVPPFAAFVNWMFRVIDGQKSHCQDSVESDEPHGSEIWNWIKE